MTDAQQQVSQSEQQIQQENETQNTTPAQQQQKDEQTQDQYAEQIQTILKKIFAQQTFLRNKYCITGCYNKDLEISFLHVIQHNKFSELNQQVTNAFSNPLVLQILVQEQIVKCDYIKYDTERQVAKPKFHRERNTIKVGQVSPVQLQQLQKFIEGNSEYKFYTEEELENIQKQKEENSTIQTEKLNKFKTHVSNDNVLYLIADNEQLAEGLFNWLFGQKFNDIELNQLQIQEYDYYYFAYKDLFGKEPTGFKIPQTPLQQQTKFANDMLKNFNNQQLIQQQQMQFNSHKMVNKFQQGGYQQYNKNRTYNNNNQANPRPYNNNIKTSNPNYGKPRYNNNQASPNANPQKFQGKSRYNNNNNSQRPRGNHHHNNNKNSNYQQNKSKGYEANMEDNQQFPDL